MNSPSRTEYGRDTYTEHRYPWGFFTGARALCADGRVRTCTRISETADTFFSVPAAVRVSGRTVSGYVTFETAQGWSTPTDEDPTVCKFIANRGGKNADALPAGAHKEPGPPSHFDAILARYDARAAERRRIERRAATFERAAIAAALAGPPTGPLPAVEAYQTAARAMRRASHYDAIVMSTDDRDAARAGEER